MWIYKGRPVESISDFGYADGTLFGFVYLVTNLATGKLYIGRKNFYSVTKRMLAIKERTADRRRKVYKHVRKQSKWLDYWGSCALLKEDIETLGQGMFRREILEVSCTGKLMGYLELKYMFAFDVLGRDTYNGNVAGRYYARDLENLCEPLATTKNR